jgi:hypothetical protein
MSFEEAQFRPRFFSLLFFKFLNLEAGSTPIQTCDVFLKKMEFWVFSYNVFKKNHLHEMVFFHNFDVILVLSHFSFVLVVEH